MNTTGTPLPPESVYQSRTPGRSAADSRRVPDDPVADCGAARTVAVGIALPVNISAATDPAPASFNKTERITCSFRDPGVQPPRAPGRSFSARVDAAGNATAANPFRSRSRWAFSPPCGCGRAWAGSGP